MRRLKRIAAGAAARLGVLAPATDLYLFLRSRRQRRNPSTGVDGATPLPPPILRLSSAGTTDVDWFVRSGAAAHRLVEELTPAGGAARVLDFGCGCGRVLRHVEEAERHRYTGVDWNARVVRWCRRNLAPASFVRCGLAPPLPLDGAQRFGFVYAFSVFTHLPGELQTPWMAELSARLADGGLLLVSTHGKSYLSDLAPDERERFLAGELVVRQPAAAGTNVCAAYHPPESFEGWLPDGLEVAEHRPAGALGNPTQDLWVIRRRPRPPAAQ